MVVTGPATAKLKIQSDNAAASTIDASALTLASGSAALLEYAGEVKADTITGGIQSETILHSIGADVLDGGGGSGVDTLSIATSIVTPTNSANPSTGAVINLGTSAVNSVSVYAALTQYTANGADVGTNALSYNFAANLATNLAETQSVSNIENVLGGNGKDYIVGTAGNNAINGNGAADYIDGGDGDDTITVDSSAEAGSDKIHGGLGNDTISVTAAGSATLSATDTDITGIENIAVGAGGTAVMQGQTEDFAVSGATGTETYTGGLGADDIDLGAGADTHVYLTNGDGAAAVTITNTTSAADDFVVSSSDADSVAFVTATDFIKIDGALETSLEASAARKISSSTANLDYNAAGVFIIATAQGQLDADNFGDVSDVVANFAIGNGTETNNTAGDEILFTIENNAASENGLYYFKDADGNGAISVGDTLALLAVIEDAALVAADIII
jgi:Ca2+-binding RTX toxin-like protein